MKKRRYTCNTIVMVIWIWTKYDCDSELNNIGAILNVKINATAVSI